MEEQPHREAGSERAPLPGPAPDEVDMSFSASIPPDVARFGESTPPAPICQWCNAALPTGDPPRCPGCGALLHPADGAAEVPGLTEIPRTAPASLPAARSAGVGGWPTPPTVTPRTTPDLSAYEGLTPEEIQLLANSSAALRQEITQLGSQEAFQPPNRDVRRAMLEIEFEADRADPMRIVDPGPLAEHRSEEPTV